MLAVLAGATPLARGQALPGAEANQLHAAIENGDVDALRYWLTARHVDPNTPASAQPDVTPLAHCLRLAARVLDAPSGGPSQSAPVGLRVLQDMVMLLDEHGARLADPERQRFSAPVLRWYEDAIARPGQTTTTPTTADAPPPPPVPTPSTAAPEQATPASPPPPSQPSAAGDSGQAGPFSREGLVVLVLDPRKECNSAGHVVFLENRMLLGITAKVSTHRDGKGRSKPKSSTDTYAVDPQGSWALGCDVTTDGARVRYVLEAWQ